MLALLPAVLAGQEIRYSGSVGYTQGDYIFTERTSSMSLLNGVSLRVGRFGARLSLPVIMQDSRALTYLHGVPVPTGGPDSDAVRQRQSGEPIRMGRRHNGTSPGTDSVWVTEPGDFEMNVGDPMLSGSIEVYQGFDAVRSVELRGQMKAPLADVDSGVGSGEWDFGAGGSLAIGAGRALLFLDATYWWLGDMADLELEDYVDYGAGLGVPLGDRWSALASFAGASRIIDGVDPPASVSVSFARRLAAGGSLNAGVGIGLTESAADVSVFLGWGFRLFGGP